jgi:superfamily I DNA/RNA helicase
VKMIARDILGHEGAELPSLATTIAAISRAKNRGITGDELEVENPIWHDKFAHTVFKRLQDSMRAYNAVDFDSLLGLTVELFEKYPEVLDTYQEQYRYIMIDEYQDTNPIQYRLAALLSAKYQNLCVVGDDDQSIYGWRGAEVKNILEFERATVIKLEQNYRSTNTILKGANAVIGHNTTRHHKNLWSQCGEGEPIEVFVAPTDAEEAQAVIGRLVKFRETWHLRWKDFAILYRSNALSRQFELELMRHTWRQGDQWMRGVPYQVYGGQEFYERREVKDLFAYLRVVVNPLDQEALLRVINQPRRGIGEASLDLLTARNRSESIPLWNVLRESHHKLSSKCAQGVRNFVQVVEEAQQRFKQNSLPDTMRWMIDRINYKKAIVEEVKSSKMREFNWENVEEFVSSLADFEQEAKNEGKSPELADFVSSFPLGSDKRLFRKDLEEDKVNLLTFHSAKGLEFKVCFLVGMEDTIIPHEKSMRETGLEEERRLMYVAMTRAMRYLTLSMSRTRKRMGQENSNKPSRFLYEIPQELIKATVWNQT